MRSLLTTLLRPLAAGRRRVLIHRRGLAALLLGLAVLLGLRAVTAPPPATVPAWTAAHDLAGGTVLDAGDLVSRPVPPDAVPAGAIRSAEAAIGRLLAAPVRRGEPVTDVRLLGRALLRDSPGLVATPVRLADTGVLDLLRVGDRIDLVAVDPQGERGAVTVARSVRVLMIPPERPAAADTGVPGGLVVLAVPHTQATNVAGAGVSGFLTALLSR